MTVCIIPARGGSKRIPRKNVKPFCGRPMIEWSVRAALAAGVFERVIVSTDDAEIAKVAAAAGAERPFTRPAALADDYATTMDVMAHAVAELGLGDEEAVCCLYATAPFVQPSDLAAGQRVLQDADFALAATHFAFPIQRALRQTPDGLVEMVNPEEFTTRSQDLEERLHDAGQFYWARSAFWKAGGSPYEGRVAPIILPRARVQDIDTPEDWDQAEAMFMALGLGPS